MTNEERIIEHFKKHRSITHLRAVQKYNMLNFTCVISRLRKSGMEINDKMQYRVESEGKQWVADNLPQGIKYKIIKVFKIYYIDSILTKENAENIQGYIPELIHKTETAIADYFGYTVGAFMNNKSRKTDIVICRQYFSYIMLNYYNVSDYFLENYLKNYECNFDRCTLRHGEKVIINYISSAKFSPQNKEKAEHLNKIIDLL